MGVARSQAGWVEKFLGDKYWGIDSSKIPGVGPEVSFFPRVPLIFGPPTVENTIEKADCERTVVFSSLNFSLSRGWGTEQARHCFLKADVKPSQAINNPAHSAWILLKQSGEILTAYCTCTAG